MAPALPVLGKATQAMGLGSLVGEYNVCAALFLLTAAYGVMSASKVKELRTKEIAKAEKDGGPQRVPSAGKWQDHPLVSWMITNTCVFSIWWLKWQVIPPAVPGHHAWNWCNQFLTGNILIDGIMAVNWVVINKVYAHTPFFSTKRVGQTYMDILKDYLSCNFVGALFGSTVQTLIYHFTEEERILALSRESGHFRPLRFMFRLAWARVWVDVCFWLFHCVLHWKQVYPMHKKHHEHNRTQHTTNYHFAWYDLIIEGFLPGVASQVAYELTFGPIANAENELIFAFVLWHEISSHAGKALPTMSVFPPLSPFLQRWDDWNIWAHEMHHNVLKCNYSISWWFDHVAGTLRWK